MKNNNNYNFWNGYLNQVVLRIEKLLKVKEYIYTDFHIHSDYSVDGEQTLIEIINRSEKIGLDIIAITDHDSIKVYDELYEYLKTNNSTNLIIIPGVEFTVDNAEYGSQFHILQLMINPKDKDLTNDIDYNAKAGWSRAKLQFQRIRQNKALKYLLENYNIKCSLKDYKEYLHASGIPLWGLLARV